jgi:hypothetical protein
MTLVMMAHRPFEYSADMKRTSAGRVLSSTTGVYPDTKTSFLYGSTHASE